jgi:hypothetical protein
MMNNNSSDLNGSNMYDLCKIKCITVCESGFNNLTEHLQQWWYEELTIADKPSNYKLHWNKKTDMTKNNTTPLLIIIHTNIQTAQTKP